MTYSGQPLDSPGDALEHYGVKGMRWGHRKADDSGASKPSRAERKALNKASARKEAMKLQTFAQKPKNARDKDILEARARLSRETQKYKDAKAQYKIDKQNLGKASAKVALRNQGDVLANVRERSDRLTSREQDVYNKMIWGQAIAGIVSGGRTGGIPNTRTFSGQMENEALKNKARRRVEQEAARGF